VRAPATDEQIDALRDVAGALGDPALAEVAARLIRARMTMAA
jgi:hypothetical protein